MTLRAALAVGVALVLAACGDKPPAGWPGYANADYVYVASPIAGTLSTLAVAAVAAGRQVKAGDALFELDAEAERAAREEASARLAVATAQAADADKGKRDPEVAVNQAQLAQARAQAELARHDLDRKRELQKQNFIARAQVDEAQAALSQAQARVAELQATVQVARLPARTDERAAAAAQVEAARQALRQAQGLPASATLEDVFIALIDQAHDNFAPDGKAAR